jgi:hypothetical protein
VFLNELSIIYNYWAISDHLIFNADLYLWTSMRILGEVTRADDLFRTVAIWGLHLDTAVLLLISHLRDYFPAKVETNLLFQTSHREAARLLKSSHKQKVVLTVLMGKDGVIDRIMSNWEILVDSLAIKSSLLVEKKEESQL